MSVNTTTKAAGVTAKIIMKISKNIRKNIRRIFPWILPNIRLTTLNNSFIAQGDNIRQQSEIIEKLTYQLEELQNQKDKLHSNLENIFIQFNKRVVIGYVIGGIGAVLALISFLI